MKFLVISRPRSVQQGMTSAMVQATKEIVNGYVKSGKFDCLYRFAGGNGVCAIANADSGDALEDLLQELPTAPFVEYESHPLADCDKFLEKLIEGMKKQGL
jgi:muconolactone delta-isomerase